jgi:hypothetical protein
MPVILATWEAERFKTSQSKKNIDENLSQPTVGCGVLHLSSQLQWEPHRKMMVQTSPGKKQESFSKVT